MGNWFKTQTFNRMVGNALVSVAILGSISVLTGLLGLALPLRSLWAGCAALLAVFGIPLLANLAPSFLKPYVRRFAGQERTTKSRLIELSAVVAILLLWIWLI